MTFEARLFRSLRPRKPRRASALRPQPVRDRSFRRWIASLPCCCCFIEPWRAFGRGEISLGEVLAAAVGSDIQKSPTECAHVGSTGKGMRQKCSDAECLPLCGGEHHREGRESHHKLTGRFFTYHALPAEAIIARLNEEYRAEVAA